MKINQIKVASINHASQSIIWLAVFFYLDPGGYIAEFWNVRFAKNVFLVLTWSLFIYNTNFKGINRCLNDKSFQRIVVMLMIWYIYFVVVFLIIRDDYATISLISRFVKTRHILSGWLIIFPTYYYITYGNPRIFIKIFTRLSILIAVLFLLNVFFSLELIFTHSSDRGYVSVLRHLLNGYGILEIGLYLLIATIIVPRNKLSSDRKMLIISSIGIYLIYILSLTRRYFAYIGIASIIGYVLSNRIFKTSGTFQRKAIFVFIGLTILLGVFFQDYLFGIIEGFKTITFDETESYGTTASRLGLFSHEPIYNMFRDNPIFGTGYINEWYTNTEGTITTNYDLSGADYVFTSSVAMFGIFGILLFIPFYFLLFRNIKHTFKIITVNISYLKKHLNFFYPTLVLITGTALFFLRHMITYPDWFSFIGPQSVFEKYFILLGIYYGCSRKLKLNLVRLKNNKLTNEK